MAEYVNSVSCCVCMIGEQCECCVLGRIMFCKELSHSLNVAGSVHDLAPQASSTPKPSNSKDKGLKSESCHGLNVVGFRVGEEIRRAERDLTRLRESLSHHAQGSTTHATIFSKMEDKQGELDRLRASERSINLEQSQRKDCKKLTVF